MKLLYKALRNFIPVFSILAVIIIILILLKVINICEPDKYIFPILTIPLGLYSALYTLLATSKMEYEIFSKCNKKYDKLNDDLNRILKNEKTERDETLLIYDYLNICSEEYFLYNEKGIIPESVWKQWLSGMKNYFLDEKFQKTIMDEFKNPNNNGSYYGFLDFIIKELNLKD